MKVVEIIGGGLSGLSLGVYLRELGVPVKDGGRQEVIPGTRFVVSLSVAWRDEVLQQMGIEGAFRGAMQAARGWHGG